MYLDQLNSLLQVILVDLVLAGDNAIVIGLVASTLEKEQRRLEPFMHFAVPAARMAVEDAGIESDRIDTRRAGVVVGSGIGGITTLEKQHVILRERGPDRNSPFMIPQMIINMAAGVIAKLSVSATPTDSAPSSPNSLGFSLWSGHAGYPNAGRMPR